MSIAEGWYPDPEGNLASDIGMGPIGPREPGRS